MQVLPAAGDRICRRRSHARAHVGTGILSCRNFGKTGAWRFDPRSDGVPTYPSPAFLQGQPALPDRARSWRITRGSALQLALSAPPFPSHGSGHGPPNNALQPPRRMRRTRRHRLAWGQDGMDACPVIAVAPFPQVRGDGRLRRSMTVIEHQRGAVPSAEPCRFWESWPKGKAFPSLQPASGGFPLPLPAGTPRNAPFQSGAAMCSVSRTVSQVRRAVRHVYQRFQSSASRCS